jgi:dihydroorotase
VTTTAMAAAYRERILAARPAGSRFQPLMTLYLTDRTDPREISKAKASGFIHGCKLYPAGATTNSDQGVTDITNIFPVLEAMSELGMPLQVHGEVTSPDVDIFVRENRFIDLVLVPLTQRFPGLRIVFEHITTQAAVQFVRSHPVNVGATLTPQHLLLNRNDLFSGGIRPHLYCLPVLKREADRIALLDAVSKGDPRFFLGTDSAPHARSTKEAACGCAGVYSAHAALELYAEAFESIGALHRLEAFASLHGPRFYGLTPNEATVTLERSDWKVPASYPFANETIVPLRAGEKLAWRLVH